MNYKKTDLNKIFSFKDIAEKCGILLSMLKKLDADRATVRSGYELGTRDYNGVGGGL